MYVAYVLHIFSFQAQMCAVCTYFTLVCNWRVFCARVQIFSSFLLLAYIHYRARMTARYVQNVCKNVCKMHATFSLGGHHNIYILLVMCLSTNGKRASIDRLHKTTVLWLFLIIFNSKHSATKIGRVLKLCMYSNRVSIP